MGKHADLILIDGNPFDDIEFFSNPLGVMASGRWFDRAALQKMMALGVPVIGAVHHVCEADETSSTYFDIVVGKNFSGKLPAAIICPLTAVVCQSITPGECRIRLLTGQHEFRPAGGRFECIGETAAGSGTAGRGFLPGCRFQNRIDSLIFGSWVSFYIRQ